jgi:Flp pilus assembly protein CpaB
VLLLTKPPYLRWLTAVALFTLAVAWDVSGRATEAVPFAAGDIDRGARIEAEDVEWRHLPKGSVEVAILDGARAVTAIRAGDPITRSVAGAGPVVPGDWWSVPVDLPASVAVGSMVRLVLPGGTTTDGIVAVAPSDDMFSGGSIGAVAVPEGVVAKVAEASAAGLLLVLIAP